MRIRINLEGVSAVRAGLRSRRTGQYVCPEGKHHGKTEHGVFFYVADDNAMDVPDDVYELLISAGSSYYPLKKTLSPGDGEPICLTVVPELLDGFRGHRWLDADLHIHGPDRDAPNPRPITAKNVPVEIVAENIRFACLVDGVGESLVYGKNRTLIQAVEYRNGTYGHYLFFSGCRPSVHEREQYPPEKPYPLPLEFFNRIRHLGTTVFCAHPVTRCAFDDMTSWPGGGYARGLLCFLAAGLVDAITLADFSTDTASTKQLWYHLLNLGFKIPAVAGSDVCVRHRGFPPPGTWRTLIEDRDDVSFGGFLAAVRRGRALLSTAPLLKIEIDGHTPGDCVPKDRRRPMLSIDLDSPEVVDVVRIIVDGKVRDEVEVGARRWEYKTRLDDGMGSWLVVECSGTASWHYPHGLWAHTNPIYLSGRVNAGSLAASRQYCEEFRGKLDHYLAMRRLNEEERKMVFSTLGGATFHGHPT